MVVRCRRLVEAVARDELGLVNTKSEENASGRYTMWPDPRLTVEGFSTPVAISNLLERYTPTKQNCVSANLLKATLASVLFNRRVVLAWPVAAWDALFRGSSKKIISKNDASTIKRILEECSLFEVNEGSNLPHSKTVTTIQLNQEIRVALVEAYIRKISEGRFSHESEALVRDLQRPINGAGDLQCKRRDKSGRKQIDHNFQAPASMVASLQRINANVLSVQAQVDLKTVEAALNQRAERHRIRTQEIIDRIRRIDPSAVNGVVAGDVHEWLARQGERWRARLIPWDPFASAVKDAALLQEAFLGLYSIASQQSQDFTGNKNLILPRQCLLYKRVFTNGLKHGGRFYSRFSSLPSAWRRALFLGGEPAVEVDFKAMQPRMLYHLEGHEAPEDPYSDLGLGKQDREAAKRAFNTVINSASQREASMSLAWENQLKRLRRGQADKVFLLPQGSGSVDEFLNRMSEKTFAPIANYFFTGFGTTLQRLDSDIAEAVMMAMVNADIPCLSVHDSFLVPQSRQAFLEDAMNSAYETVMGKGCKPLLKVEQFGA